MHLVRVSSIHLCIHLFKGKSWRRKDKEPRRQDILTILTSYERCGCGEVSVQISDFFREFARKSGSPFSDLLI